MALGSLTESTVMHAYVAMGASHFVGQVQVVHTVGCLSGHQVVPPWRCYCISLSLHTCIVDVFLLDEGPWPVADRELLLSSEVYWPTCGHRECMALILRMLIAAHWVSHVAVAVHRLFDRVKGICMWVTKRMLLGRTGLDIVPKG